MFQLFWISVIASVLALPNVKAEVWDKWSDPMRMGRVYETRFDRLPLTGALASSVLPWSDSYWPDHLGGIAFRWLSEQPEGFSVIPPSRDQAQRMSLDELARLSPAEKFDLYLGRFDYPLTFRVRAATHPTDPRWEGICQGWAAAALLYREPEPVTLPGRDGLLIPFGSADIKALIAYYYAKIDPGLILQVGNRCQVDLLKNPVFGGSPPCFDVNAGAFHLVIANQLGLLGEGVIADLDRSKQIWNHPVHGFESRLLEERTQFPRGTQVAPGTARQRLVETRLHYAVEALQYWYPARGTSYQKDESQTYRYWLDLAADDRILGGTWVVFPQAASAPDPTQPEGPRPEVTDRPDFLWLRNKVEFQGDFSVLNELYQPVGLR